MCKILWWFISLSLSIYIKSCTRAAPLGWSSVWALVSGRPLGGARARRSCTRAAPLGWSSVWDRLPQVSGRLRVELAPGGLALGPPLWGGARCRTCLALGPPFGVELGAGLLSCSRAAPSGGGARCRTCLALGPPFWVELGAGLQSCPRAAPSGGGARAGHHPASGRPLWGWSPD